MSLQRISGEHPQASGFYPVFVGNSASPVIGYWNSRDGRWFVNGLRNAAVAVWLGPDPLPERRA